MRADVKVICPECGAEFVSCNEHGISFFSNFDAYVRCPEPSACELSGKIYRMPEDIELQFHSEVD